MPLGEHIEKRLSGCEDNTHFIGTQRPPPPKKMTELLRRRPQSVSLNHPICSLFMKSKGYLGPVQSGFLIWEWELNAMS